LKKFNLKLSVCTVLIGAMCMLNVGTAFAASNQVTSEPSTSQAVIHHHGGKAFCGAARQKMSENLQVVLSAMVAGTTITQDQSNAVLQYLKDQAAARKAQFKAMKASAQNGTTTNPVAKTPRTNLFSAIVQKGILTADQANTLKQQLQQKVQQARQDNMTNKLNALVSAGTITQDQAATIEKYFTTAESNMKADFEKIKSMSADQRSAYFKQMKANRINPLAQMVKDGVITQQQSDAIAKALHPGAGSDKNAAKGTNRIQKELAKLVANNTISQQQADSIQVYAQKAIVSLKANFANIKSMSPQDRIAAIQKMQAAGKDLLNQLVTNNVITQAQADAITKYFSSRSHIGFAHHWSGQVTSSSNASTGTAASN
jgi:polyhydroxyalkanoate synthesis regulator phasin